MPGPISLQPWQNDTGQALKKKVSFPAKRPALTKVQDSDVLGEDGSQFEMRVKILKAPVDSVSTDPAEGGA